jgi:hypothetical protein
MLAEPSHVLLSWLTLSTSRCRPPGSASAMPITAAVMTVLTGLRLRRPKDESDICACRNSQVTGLRLRLNFFDCVPRAISRVLRRRRRHGRRAG